MNFVEDITNYILISLIIDLGVFKRRFRDFANGNDQRD